MKARPPDFLVIGAQKAATTWLHLVLSEHPDLWLPPAKEVHHFDHGGRILPHRLSRGAAGLWLLEARKASAIWRRRRRDGMWFARYVFGTRSDRWYRGLFAAAGPRLAGDITPNYATLDDRRIAWARRVAPTARIIYILRDPVARAWSFARVGVGDRPAPDRLLDLMRRPGTVANSDYAANFDRWRRAFGDERIRVLYHEDLETDPAQFLRSVCTFLDVDAEPVLKPGLMVMRANRGTRLALPENLREPVAETYRGIALAADRTFGSSHTAQWMRNIETLEAGGVLPGTLSGRPTGS